MSIRPYSNVKPQVHQPSPTGDAPVTHSATSFQASLENVSKSSDHTGSDTTLARMSEKAVRSIRENEKQVDRIIRQASAGTALNQEQLIAVQVAVYRYTQELELAGKLVDKTTGAVKQTLQSQT